MLTSTELASIIQSLRDYRQYLEDAGDLAELDALIERVRQAIFIMVAVGM
jgi:hypothetical protein